MARVENAGAGLGSIQGVRIANDVRASRYSTIAPSSRVA